MARLRGADAPNASLSPEQVTQVRSRYALGEPLTKLSEEYDRPYLTLWRVVNHLTYRDEGDERLTDA